MRSSQGVAACGTTDRATSCPGRGAPVDKIIVDVLFFAGGDNDNAKT